MRAAAEFALTFGVVASAFEAPTRGRTHELFEEKNRSPLHVKASQIKFRRERRRRWGACRVFEEPLEGGTELGKSFSLVQFFKSSCK